MDKFVLRLPNGMRDEIARMAQLSGRSMNAEIVQRLESSLTKPHDPPRSWKRSEKLDALDLLRKCFHIIERISKDREGWKRQLENVQAFEAEHGELAIHPDYSAQLKAYEHRATLTAILETTLEADLQVRGILNKLVQGLTDNVVPSSDDLEEFAAILDGFNFD